MINKEALQYIVGLGEANIKEVELWDGSVEKFSDKPLHRLDPYIPRANAIKMRTLTSLVDYIKGNIDVMPEKMIVHVESPEKVSLYSMLDADRGREYLVEVFARIPDFTFNSFMDNERFCINLQSKFLSDSATDKELVLKFAGTVESGTVAQYGDDGVTQKATIKTGISSKEAALIPNPVKLRPYRTFLEVEQPVSDFIFRMKEGARGGVECALFEADGGAWMIAATTEIKNYLEYELADLTQFTVIS